MIVPAIILSINIKQNLGNKENYEPDEPFDIVIVDLFYLCNSYPRTDPWKDFRKYWKCAEKMRIPTERISISFYWKIFALVTKNSLETRKNIAGWFMIMATILSQGLQRYRTKTCFALRRNTKYRPQHFLRCRAS